MQVKLCDDIMKIHEILTIFIFSTLVNLPISWTEKLLVVWQLPFVYGKELL